MAVYEKWNETITADEFLKVLTENYERVELIDCTIQGSVDLREAGIHIFRGFACKGCTFKEEVNFVSVAPQQQIDFSRTKFCQKADFSSTYFRGYADFTHVHFENRVDFRKTQFMKGANFSEARFSIDANFTDAVFARSYVVGSTGGSVPFSVPADFANVQYFSDTIPKRLWQAPTEFYLYSQHIDEVTNPHFKRYVADQQFLRDFKEKHRFWAFLWRWSSDYGRSVGLWATWVLVLTIAFALVYYFCFPDCFNNTKVDIWTFFYYSVATFTTLGGDIVPMHFNVKVIVMIEVFLGYVMLGGLISIFANKLARRS